MARRPMVLVTGGSGEMAHDLIHRFAEGGTVDVVALDVRPLDPELARRCAFSLTGDVRDRRLLERLRSEFEIHAISTAPGSWPASTPSTGRWRGPTWSSAYADEEPIRASGSERA
jgi:nucleoside-diphosphate-sugar epimerase